jgi:hypothetical protein
VVNTRGRTHCSHEAARIVAPAAAGFSVATARKYAAFSTGRVSRSRWKYVISRRSPSLVISMRAFFAKASGRRLNSRPSWGLIDSGSDRIAGDPVPDPEEIVCGTSTHGVSALSVQLRRTLRRG